MAIGSTEIVILVVFGILIFGANKIPQLARGVGRAKGEFQMGMKEASEMAAIGDMDRGSLHPLRRRSNRAEVHRECSVGR